MQQQCVYFHTEKEPKETENILKKEKMQIIFKTNQVEMRLQDLTEEEKDSWQKFQLEQIKMHLEVIEIYEHQHQENFEKIKSKNKEIAEIIQSCLTSVENLKVVNKANRKRLKLTLKSVRSHRELYFTERGMMDYPSQLFENNRIICSCIIAKQGENFVRYLQFLENQDPVLTITGPNADSIKSTLEEKF